MGLGIDVLKFIRKTAPGLYGQGAAQPHANGRGDSLVALGMPGVAEVVRMRESYGAIAATAVAPVVALPTTTAQLSLWNGEQQGGKSYVIDSVFAHVVVSAGVATGVGIVGMINKRAAAQMVADITPFGLAGHVYAGSGIVDVGATVVDDGWHPIGNSIIGPASQVAMNVDIPVNGLYIVPPGGAFSIAVVANTVTTITAKMGFRWHEMLVDLG